MTESPGAPHSKPAAKPRPAAKKRTPVRKRMAVPSDTPIFHDLMNHHPELSRLDDRRKK